MTSQKAGFHLTLYEKRSRLKKPKIDFSVLLFLFLILGAKNVIPIAGTDLMLVSPPPPQGHHREVWCLTISPSGDHIVSSSHDKSLRLWERTREPIILEEEREMVRMAASRGRIKPVG